MEDFVLSGESEGFFKEVTFQLRRNKWLGRWKSHLVKQFNQEEHDLFKGLDVLLTF